jgi:two-component system sensor histidine kinase KdpD
LDNGAKYSPADSTITIKSHASEGGVEVSVSDEGPGIPPEMRETVFDKFVRLDKHAAGGLGLGLAIARRIVEAHKGRIWVEAGEGGKGARFAFVIPVND